MVPNIIHFIYFIGPKSRPFGYTNYLAIKRAHDVQNPDVIYFHYNEEPEDNVHWQNMKKYVTMVKVDPPEIYEGIELKYPQYQADVVRLQVLLEHGGIYLDTDIIMIKPFDNLMDHQCVLGGEGYSNNQAGLNSSDPFKLTSISNAVILAEPRNRFISEWLKKLPEAFKSDVWAYHAVVLPLEMYKKDRSYFHLERVESFIPFDFRNEYIFEEGSADKYKHRLKNSYTIHLWETIWKDRLAKIDDEYIEKSNNLFTLIVK